VPPRPVMGDSFTFLYVDDVRTSQDTRVGLRGLLRGIALLFVCRCSYLIGYTYGPPRTVTGDSFTFLDVIESRKFNIA
jgi:hypothetical protein